MNDHPINLTTFRELQDTAGEEFVRELVDTFLQETPPMLEQLRQALAAGHADDFRRAAHSLKSNSQTFGAVALGERARELELGGLDGARRDGGALLQALQLEYERAATALRTLSHG